MIERAAGIGVQVRSTRNFPDIAKGTLGVIFEDYGTGIQVSWQLGTCIQRAKDVPPIGIASCKVCGEHHVRDGFDKRTELEYLEIAGDSVTGGNYAQGNSK